MTRYLTQLIAQARGAEPLIKPRLRSRFEPEGRVGDGLTVEDLERPEIGATAVEARPLPGAGAETAMTERPARGTEDIIRPTSEQTVVRERHEHSERIERIEQRTVERERIVERPAAPPPVTLVSERIERPVFIESRTPVVVIPPDFEQRSESGRAPARPIAQDTAPANRPEAAVQARALPAPSAAIAVEAAPAAVARRDEQPFAPSAPPEITISIGVLDIRLTQEAEPDRRAGTTRAAREGPPLALSDYLAKRSEGGS